MIDHEDLDRIAAETLIEARPAAVVNASASVSGRYPNVGPLLLSAAGIPLIDEVGSDVLELLAEGTVIDVVGNRVIRKGERVAEGTRQTIQTLEERIARAKASMGAELERFAENTLSYLRRSSTCSSTTRGCPRSRRRSRIGTS